MHKKGRHKRSNRPKIKEKKPKVRWARFLLVPAAFAALAYAGFSVWKKPDSPHSTVISAADAHSQQPDAGNQFVRYHLKLRNGNTLDLFEKDVAKTFLTSCCEVVVLARNSRALAEFHKRSGEVFSSTFEYGSMHDIQGLSWGTNSYPDGTRRGMSFVKHPQDAREHRNLSEEDTCNSFTQAAMENILYVAHNGNAEDRIRLARNITEQLPFEEGSGPLTIYQAVMAKSGKAAADSIMESIAAGTIFKKSLLARAGGEKERKKAKFLNLIVHESVHSAQRKYFTENRLKPPSGDASEIFAHLSVVAYGQNFWYHLHRMATHGSNYFIEIALDHLGDNINKDEKAKLEKELKFSMFFTHLLVRLSRELKLSSIMELPDKSEKEVRAAAKAILDRESIRYFGKPFGEVVPISDLEQIRKKGEEYLDSLK